MNVQALWPKRNGMLAIDDRQDDRHIEILREARQAEAEPRARHAFTLLLAQLGAAAGQR